MSITQAGIHANKLWNRTVRKMEVEGFTPKNGRGRETLSQALSKAREGMTIEKRRNLLISTLVVSAGHVLGEWWQV